MEKKKDNTAFKNNVETGASSAVGAAAGVVLGSVVAPVEVQAQVMPTPQPIPEPASQPVPEPAPQPVPEPVIPEPEPEPIKPIGGDTLPPEPEVEVVAYERMTDENGNQADLAVISVDGSEVGILDADLDGEADLLMADLNQNGMIEEGECEVVQGQGLSMQPLQDAAGFSPLYAQNDLPDYVNDADVDTYMA